MKVTNRPVLDDVVTLTPEMIRAGVRELDLSFNCDGVLDASEDVVADVFLAMMRQYLTRRRVTNGEQRYCS